MAPTGDLHATQSAFLARESELEGLQQALEVAHAGRGGLLLLSGPAGTGITRTAHEAAARADRLGSLVLWGRSFEGTYGRPYGALAEALEEYAASLDPAQLEAELGAGGPALARVLPRLRLWLAALTPAAPLDARDERLRLHTAVLAWLSRASRAQPLLIVLDDLQWADGDTLRLLEYLARRAGDLPLLLLGGYAEYPQLSGEPKDALTVPIWERLRADVATGTVELSGLDEGATAAALAPLADEPVSSDVVSLIQAVTSGEPLFARELYRHLHEENRLGRVGGRDLPTVEELPDTFERLIAWRASRLSPEVRTAITALACFPDGAEPAIVAEVSGLSRGRLIEFLEAAAARGLCRSMSQGQRYAMTHDRIRRALLSSMSGIQHAHLQRRVAEVLEGELAGRAREHAGELLHHYRLSASVDRAERGLQHGLIAAEQARATYAHLRAADCLRACLTLADSGERPAPDPDLLGRLAEAEAEAGLTDQALASAAGSLRGRRQPGARSSEALEPVIHTLRVLRGDGLDQGEIVGLEDVRRLGLEQAARADALTRARLELLAEHWEVIESGSVRTLHWSTAEPNLVRPLRDVTEEVDQAALFLPQAVRTRAESSRAAGFARSWRRPAAVLHALKTTVTDLVTRHGLFSDGGSWAGLYAAASERYGSVRDRLAAMILLGRCQAVLGHLVAAEESSAAAEELLDDLPEPGMLVTELLLTRLVIAHYRDGPWPELAGRLAAALATPSPAGLALTAEMCLAHVRTGSDADARQLLPSLFDAIGQLAPLTFYRDAALVATLSAAWELGAAEHSGRGRTLIDLAVAGSVGAQPHGSLRLSRARMVGLTGDVAEAQALFAEERPVLEEAGLRPLRAILDYDEAVTLAAAGASRYGEAATLIERAAGQFGVLGMPGWLDRTRVLSEAGFEAAAQPGGRLHFTYPEGLSRREADLVRLVADGLSAAQAAEALGLEPAAAERHLEAALEKLGAGSPEQLPRVARRHGLGGV
jgi:DNA-binding CsgD family transcriptional regulator